MAILVSSANGKVGQEVARALLAAGQPVRIGARNVARASAEFPDAGVVALDFLRPETLTAAMTGVEAVFSAVPYEALPEAEANLIAAARAAGVGRYVKLSAMGVDGDPTSPHMVAERALAESGLQWTVLRPNFFMQNYALMMADAVRAGTIYEPAADGATSFVDTRDIAAVAVAALTTAGHHGRAYALTGPAALTRAEVAAAIGDARGRPVAYVAVDDAALRGAMAGAAPALTELMVTLYGYVRQGWTASVTPDVEAVTGRPARDFAGFARDYADAWR